MASPSRIAFAVILAAAFGGGWWVEAQDHQRENKPQSVYARNANDPWNRIFDCLFSRRVTFRYSTEFSEGAPFTPAADMLSLPPAARELQFSSRIFARLETGDRAIDSLYRIDPVFPSPYRSPQPILDEPLYARLKEALQEAQNDNKQRPALARALMQSDLWSAFDALDVYPAKSLSESPDISLAMLAQLIKKIALTPGEIGSLPDNFSLSLQNYGLPDIFRPASGWLEVQWFTHRDHDDAAGFRRVSCVFIKPTHLTGDTQEFLDSLRGPGTDWAGVLDGAAIITQPLLIDNQGRLKPSAITTEAEIRFFGKTSAGASKSTEVRQYELSRQLILRRGASAAFIVEGSDAPAYLPFGGNNFSFASLQRTRAGNEPPLLVRLRTRCAACHGSDLNGVLTFNSHFSPTESSPHVKQLDPASHVEADFVMMQKAAQQNWKDLQDYMGDSPR